MEAKFKVGDLLSQIITDDYKYEVLSVDENGCYNLKMVEDKGSAVSLVGGIYQNVTDGNLKLVTPAQPAITIGSTWYWQGEKDSPVTVIGFDSKGRVVVESGFEDKDGDPVYFGEVFSYGGNAGIEGTDMFLEAYQPTIKPKKITGYVRVLKPAEGFLVNDKSDEYIFQSAVFSDEAKARAAVPYGFEVVDVVKVEWEEVE